MYAVNQGYTLLVEPLLAADANPDVRAPDGATALFMAAVHGHSGIIAQLLDAGADVSIPGPKGKTPLEVAEVQGNPKAVEPLQEIHIRKEREEAARIAQEAHAAAVSRAKSLDTLQAYEDYLKSYCPQGSFCGAANTRRSQLLQKTITGSIFRGPYPRYRNGGGYDELTLRFAPTGEIAVHFHTEDILGMDSILFGTWNVEDGKIIINGLSFSSFLYGFTGTATLNRNVLSGYFDLSDGKHSWRLEKSRIRMRD